MTYTPKVGDRVESPPLDDEPPDEDAGKVDVITRENDTLPGELEGETP